MPSARPAFRPPIVFAALLLLAGCDQVMQRMGLEDPARKEAAQEADGRAVGSACRQSGRAIEDCYAIYSWLPRSAIFSGWKEMDAYMRENQLSTIVPQLPPPEPPGSKKRKKAASEEVVATEPPKPAGGESAPARPDDKPAGKP